MSENQPLHYRPFIFGICLLLFIAANCPGQSTALSTATQNRPANPSSGAVATEAKQALPLTDSFPQLPLAKRTAISKRLAPRSKTATELPSLSQSAVRMVSSLAVVVGVFLMVLWFMKKLQGKRGMSVAGQTLELLGQTPLSKTHSLHLIRLGQRILLVSVNDRHVTSLTEINDPVEVAELLDSNPAPAAVPDSTFKRIFAQHEQNPNELFSS